MRRTLAALMVVVSSLVPSVGALAQEDEGAEQVQTYTLEEMLNLALEDEYSARSTYDMATAQFGAIGPLPAIRAAEERHMAAVGRLFTARDWSVPANATAGDVQLPETLTEFWQAGVDAEIANMAMYDRFLAQDLPDDMERVFSHLRTASEHHLAAFQAMLEGNTRPTAAGGWHGHGRTGANRWGRGMR